jgi:hypothetical protein
METNCIELTPCLYSLCRLFGTFRYQGLLRLSFDRHFRLDRRFLRLLPGERDKVYSIRRPDLLLTLFSTIYTVVTGRPHCPRRFPPIASPRRKDRRHGTPPHREPM